MLEELAQQEELNKALVTDRNERWAARIAALLDDDDDYLIIVGALHLVGDKGVPNLLRQQGIGIYQLSEPPSLK
jgi:uncharacterized protein YbaP (TraB family)